MMTVYAVATKINRKTNEKKKNRKEEERDAKVFLFLRTEKNREGNKHESGGKERKR